MAASFDLPRPRLGPGKPETGSASGRGEDVIAAGKMRHRAEDRGHGRGQRDDVRNLGLHPLGRNGQRGAGPSRSPISDQLAPAISASLSRTATAPAAGERVRPRRPLFPPRVPHLPPRRATRRASLVAQHAVARLARRQQVGELEARDRAGLQPLDVARHGPVDNLLRAAKACRAACWPPDFGRRRPSPRRAARDDVLDHPDDVSPPDLADRPGAQGPGSARGGSAPRWTARFEAWGDAALTNCSATAAKVLRCAARPWRGASAPEPRSAACPRRARQRLARGLAGIGQADHRVLAEHRPGRLRRAGQPPHDVRSCGGPCR